MYYKDVEEEIAHSPGYNFGAEEIPSWIKTPVGIAVIVAIILVIAFLVWWFFIREKPGYRGSEFKYF